MTCKECAIPMCGSEDNAEDYLVPCCENGHYLHTQCLKAMLESNPESILCPLCRSDAVSMECVKITIPAIALIQGMQVFSYL